MNPKLYRVVLPVADVETAARFYQHLFGLEGKRVSPGRHYLDFDGVILAIYDPLKDGDSVMLPPHPDHYYYAVDDLQAAYHRAQAAGAQELDTHIETYPWGERCFYCKDPFGNRMCVVDRATVFVG